MSMDTTFQELLDMRQKLNEALEAKIGRKPKSGFDIYMKSDWRDGISFCSALFETMWGVTTVSSGPRKEPQEAFDFAMSRIEGLEVKTPMQERADEIDALKKEIEALEAEQ